MTLLTILLQEAASPKASGYSSIIMMVALIAIFYFFMIRPQSKRQKEIRKFREALAEGQKVITAGGIHGKVKSIKDNTVVVEIADNVRITVDKGSIYAPQPIRPIRLLPNNSSRIKIKKPGSNPGFFILWGRRFPV